MGTPQLMANKNSFLLPGVRVLSSMKLQHTLFINIQVYINIQVFSDSFTFTYKSINIAMKYVTKQEKTTTLPLYVARLSH